MSSSAYLSILLRCEIKTENSNEVMNNKHTHTQTKIIICKRKRKNKTKKLMNNEQIRFEKLI